MAGTLTQYGPDMIAIVRELPTSFANALSANPPATPIDVALARAQHAAYRAALVAAKIDVRVLPADEALPDCCFVEDTAVVAGEVALSTRPGAPSRQGEPPAVAAVLAEYMEVATMAAPATLDGGDCMVLGGKIFVGRSARTNAAGIARLAEVFEPLGYEIVPIELPRDVLHLKCVCAPLPDGRMTLADATIPAEAFGDVDIVSIPASEAYAANVLSLGSRVLVAEGFPRTRDVLAKVGFTPHPIATTEFRKADGALTCLSVLVDLDSIAFFNDATRKWLESDR